MSIQTNRCMHTYLTLLAVANSAIDACLGPCKPFEAKEISFSMRMLRERYNVKSIIKSILLQSEEEKKKEKRILYATVPAPSALSVALTAERPSCPCTPRARVPPTKSFPSLLLWRKRTPACYRMKGKIREKEKVGYERRREQDICVDMVALDFLICPPC